MSEDKLFDDIERKELGPRFSWREFEFLNVSSGSEATACRTVLEDWFHNYPVEGRSDIRNPKAQGKSRHST
jgi:hypothetical protein